LKVLGIDPGLQVTGYGVVAVARDLPGRKDLTLVEAGIVRTDARSGIAQRLKKVHDSLSELVSELRPDVLAIEKLYSHYEHPATAILMGHVRGVVCLLSGTHAVPLVSIASTHVKKAVTGKGHASKSQMQRMVQYHLGLSKMPEPPDVADALAVAIAHIFSLRANGGRNQ
jgi:crossover junction endodeoxyribonuclease RuvC